MCSEEIFEVLYGKEKIEVYTKFLEIEKSIETSNLLYEYFESIAKMLQEDKSYIRVRGFRLLTKLAKWDDKNKIKDVLPLMLAELEDEKPTSVRQCLASIPELLKYKPKVIEEVKSKLKCLDLTKYSESMAPLINKDIDGILS